jgi:hypothetical protein
LAHGHISAIVPPNDFLAEFGLVNVEQAVGRTEVFCDWGYAGARRYGP